MDHDFSIATECFVSLYYSMDNLCLILCSFSESLGQGL